MRPKIGKTVIAKFHHSEAPAIITKADEWNSENRINATVFPDMAAPVCYSDVRLFSCKSSANEFMKGNELVRLVCYWPDRE